MRLLKGGPGGEEGVIVDSFGGIGSRAVGVRVEADGADRDDEADRADGVLRTRAQGSVGAGH
ncbi:hypothetical protein GCM10009626_09210 [Brachybacterium sacelli]